MKRLCLECEIRVVRQKGLGFRMNQLCRYKVALSPLSSLKVHW
jgi:hypothetical protein